MICPSCNRFTGIQTNFCPFCSRPLLPKQTFLQKYSAIIAGTSVIVAMLPFLISIFTDDLFREFISDADAMEELSISGGLSSIIVFFFMYFLFYYLNTVPWGWITLIALAIAFIFSIVGFAIKSKHKWINIITVSSCGLYGFFALSPLIAVMSVWILFFFAGSPG